MKYLNWGPLCSFDICLLLRMMGVSSKWPKTMFVIYLRFFFETKFAAFIYVSLPYRYTDIVKEKANCLRSLLRHLIPVISCDKVVHRWCAIFQEHVYKARHAHKRLYTVLPKYSKIQVLPGITSCRLMKYNKQAIELNSLLINNMPKDGYGLN